MKNKGQAKKKKKISLVSLPDDDTRLQTHHEEEDEEEEQQQHRGKRKKKTTGGKHRAGPAGGATARHGTGERPANGLGRQQEPVDSIFLPDCPFSSSREASKLLLPPRELPVP